MSKGNYKRNKEETALFIARLRIEETITKGKRCSKCKLFGCVCQLNLKEFCEPKKNFLIERE